MTLKDTLALTRELGAKVAEDKARMTAAGIGDDVTLAAFEALLALHTRLVERAAAGDPPTLEEVDAFGVKLAAFQYAHGGIIGRTQ